ncbi:MAG: helix-turn-helix domain-containing protein [Bacteroidota bacterium]
MTEKQNNILTTALELFANEGYTAVSTNKIAKHAGVSEGLIFRHYKNKQGLLDAIMEQAFEKVTLLYAHILMEQDPMEILRKAIVLPFEVDESEYHFWKLQFKLKWELEISGREKMQPFIDRLEWAFQELGYQEAKNEAELLNHALEGIAGGIIKQGFETQEPLKTFLLRKYNI